MKRFVICAGAAAGLWLLALAAPVQRQAQAQGSDKNKLAEKVRLILEKSCGKCHAETKLGGTFDVRNHATMLAPDRKKRLPVSQAGKEKGLKESYIWARIETDAMPEDGPLSDDDKATIKSWIEAGAPGWEEVKAKREYVSQETVLRAIYNDLKSADEEDRSYIRYFTFHTLHNNPAIKDDQLARFKAGLSKAFNSMHWKKPIVLLRALKGDSKKDDPQNTVFAFDLRDVDWDRKPDQHGKLEKVDRWQILLSYYPYGIRYDDVSDETLAKLDRDLFGTGTRNRGLANGVLVYIRADWFVAVATRSPVYENMLRLPKTVGPLEHKLGVDVVQNFKRNRLARAGFTRSGVSEQHRMIERHDSLYGAYWKSYDFKPNTDAADLLKLPLGPSLKAAYNGKYPYEEVAFKHDGGEMIFNLPNGLQGYYLTDAEGKLIEKGPIDVVNDPLKISGTNEIYNGLSCMNCHAKGMIDTGEEQVRKGTAVSGEARRKVRRLYPDYNKMKEYYETDAELFQTAAKKAMRPFLKSDREVEATFDRSREPIGELAKFYYNPDLDLARVAYELGYQDPKKFEAILESNDRFREIGLGALTNKGKLKREFWGDFRKTSLLQRTMRELNRGYGWNTR
jgi:serine/threonine-protein kinase